MHTVENAVIIPLFTLIIISLISVSGYMYDKVAMRNILNQAAIECSKDISEDELEYLLIKSEKYIEEKTIFVKNVNIKYGSDTVKAIGNRNINQIICTADWPFKLNFLGIESGGINMSQQVYKNSAEELIRKINILMK